ncbi:MAG: polyribonucleotide nucleotidyltransferase [Candidatus Omnitrophota bacterium]
MNLGRVEVPFGAQTLIIESGKVAKQANGAVVVTYGGTTVLVTACMSRAPKQGIDFFPLLVEYQEKTYSAGQIPGGFFKREGRPTKKEILTSRVMDRPIRPLFPEGFFNEVQIVGTVLSSDGQNDPDFLAIIGASAALEISDIPFSGPIGAARVVLVNDEFILNPTYDQRNAAQLEFMAVSKAEGLVMIEGEAQEVSEDKVIEALNFASQQIHQILEIQKELRRQCGKAKAAIEIKSANQALLSKVKELAGRRLKDIYKIGDKQERENARLELIEELVSDMSVYEACRQSEAEEVLEGDVFKLFDLVEYDEVRRLIFEEGRRADGRGLKEVRAISAEVDLLPRTHGSSLFTRGQTQSLAVITLGSKKDEQLVESLEGTTYENFMLHYNFPPYSVGEVKPLRGPSRRDIGHGALAAKALKAVLPTKEDFPYTIRIVSEILESNGSSSMASVCSGSMALMSAGVPVKDSVAGISIGLVTQEGKDPILLTDIMGLEDHFGDMDFKVAGTRKGVNAVQMDIKIQNVDIALLKKALEQAKEARLGILSEMEKVISKPRPDISEYAPKIVTGKIPQDKIGAVIGPGGKMIKEIIERFGCESIDIDDDGTVFVSAVGKDNAQDAMGYINRFLEEPEIGKVYDGLVKRVMNFGAFVEFLPGREGMVHVSELADKYVKDCNDVVKVGEQFKVKLVEIDKMKRFNLSKKAAEQS